MTETLQLPLLSLQVDLFHHGKRDEDDHKVVYERLLNLAVPPDPEGKGIKLEDCLEEYFNARVDVLRDSEEAKMSMSEDIAHDERPGLVHRNTVRLLRDEDSGTTTIVSASPVDMAPLHPFPTSSSISSNPPSGPGPAAASEIEHVGEESKEHIGSTVPTRLSTRQRSGSLIQRIVIDEHGKPTNEDTTTVPKSRRKGSMVVKAITIPAWQFFRLIRKFVP